MGGSLLADELEDGHWVVSGCFVGGLVVGVWVGGWVGGWMGGFIHVFIWGLS